MPEDLSLDAVSVLLVWTAVAVYALAFIAYAVDLARRSDLALKAKDAVPELVGAGAGAGARSAGAPSIADIRRAEADAELALNARPAERPRLLWARLGTALTWIGFALHTAATILRGIAAERVPWSNMYEFAMTGTLLVVMVYLVVLFRYDLRFLGTFITGLTVVLLGGAATSFYVVVVPLADPLKSVWLVIHVFVASLASAFLALAFALSIVQLLQSRREMRAIARVGAARTGDQGGDAASDRPARDGLRFLRTLPSADALESLAYRFAIIGFIFWTFTLIAGAIWANDAWGRYWGFDTKEVWTFVIWVLYAGYIHARATRGWRGNRSAWLSIVGFSAVLFNFIIVNQFFKGLHAYSGLS